MIISGASPVLMPQEDPAGKIIFAVVLLAFLLTCFVALIAFMSVALTGTTKRGRTSIERGAVSSLLTGIVSYAVFGGLAAVLYSQAFIERLLETEVVPGFLVAAVSVTIVPLALSLLGAPGTFAYIGGRVAVLHGGEMSGLRQILWGTCLSVFAAFFPIVGWFLILPWLLAVSLGAGVAALSRQNR